jgi:hypothetical protein
METKLEIAKRTSTMLFGDVLDVRQVAVLKNGEEKFAAGRANKAGELSIAISSDGSKASFLWKGKLNSRGSDSRIFQVDGFPTDCSNLAVSGLEQAHV